MLLGKVKWFDNKKGFGFIIPVNNEEKEYGDVFVHHKRIDKNGFKTLKENQLVKYEKKETANGIMAENVQLVETSTYEAMENIINELILININEEDISDSLRKLAYAISQILISEKINDNTIQINKEIIIEKIDLSYLEDTLNNEECSIKIIKAIETYFYEIDNNNISHKENQELILNNI